MTTRRIGRQNRLLVNQMIDNKKLQHRTRAFNNSLSLHNRRDFGKGRFSRWHWIGRWIRQRAGRRIGHWIGRWVRHRPRRVRWKWIRWWVAKRRRNLWRWINWGNDRVRPIHMWHLCCLLIIIGQTKSDSYLNRLTLASDISRRLTSAALPIV